MGMILLIVALGGVAIFLFALSAIPQKSPLKQTIEALESRGLQRDSRNVRAFEKLFSPERRGALKRKLMEAGWYTVTPAQMGLRVVAGGIFGFIFALVLLLVLHLNATMVTLIALGGGGIGAFMPFSSLDKAVQKRKNDVQRSLPDLLDMVATTVQAGLSLNQSLAYAVDAAPGALGEEVKAALSEIRLGRARSDALKAAAERLQQPQFTTTITAITQAEKLGTNVSKVLNELSEDVRNHRIMLVEEHAAKLPVKMVMPMGLFMLPSLFVIIFGALAANFMSQPSQ
jgi:tight adherence protein C